MIPIRQAQDWKRTFALIKRKVNTVTAQSFAAVIKDSNTIDGMFIYGRSIELNGRARKHWIEILKFPFFVQNPIYFLILSMHISANGKTKSISSINKSDILFNGIALGIMILNNLNFFHTRCILCFVLCIYVPMTKGISYSYDLMWYWIARTH